VASLDALTKEEDRHPGKAKCAQPVLEKVDHTNSLKRHILKPENPPSPGELNHHF